MNNKELITAVAEKCVTSQKECSAMLEALTDLIKGEVVEKRESQFLELGILEVREKEQKIMFNPISGKRSLIPPKLVVGFRASATVKNQIKEEGV